MIVISSFASILYFNSIGVVLSTRKVWKLGNRVNLSAGILTNNTNTYIINFS